MSIVTLLAWISGLGVIDARSQMEIDGAIPESPVGEPPLRIALVADPHISASPDRTHHAQQFERMIDQINGDSIDLVFVAGDLTDHGKLEEFAVFKELLARFDPPIYVVPGNHDVGHRAVGNRPASIIEQRLNRYRENFSSDYYVTHIGPYLRLLAINSSLIGSGLQEEQKQWLFLERVMAEEFNGQTVLLSHHPLFVEVADEPEDYFNLPPTERKRLTALLRQGGVTLALSGHLHRPLRHGSGGIEHVTAPPISFGLPRGKQRIGWSLLHLYENGKLVVEHKFEPDLATPVPDASTLSDTAKNSDRVSNRAHIFYYNWYGAPPQQPGYVHWQQGGFTPPQDIGSNFYPKLGPYSSSDPAVLRQHMQWIREAGVGVLCLTWWGKNSYEDQLTRPVLDAAAEAGLKVNFHLEPYPGSTPKSFVDDVRYIIASYGQHPAFYRATELGDKPMFYVFRALDHPSNMWVTALKFLRDSPDDALIIAQTSDLNFIEKAGFDGGYVYDVLAPFNGIPMHEQWVEEIAPQFAAAGKLFIPSVGPGYWDDRAVPDSAVEPPAAQTRDGGTDTTYQQSWRAATNAGTMFVTITSFNEWHEGSQIEPAIGHDGADGYAYPPYLDDPNQYLRQTADAVRRFEQHVP